MALLLCFALFWPILPIAAPAVLHSRLHSSSPLFQTMLLFSPAPSPPFFLEIRLLFFVARANQSTTNTPGMPLDHIAVSEIARGREQTIEHLLNILLDLSDMVLYTKPSTASAAPAKSETKGRHIPEQDGVPRARIGDEWVSGGRCPPLGPSYRCPWSERSKRLWIDPRLA